MNNFLLLKNLEREEFDSSLLANHLTRSGYVAPAKKIHDLMKAGVIVGVRRGLYVVSSPYAREPLCKETLANLIYGPSCISLESALAYYGFIPERVQHVTSVTPKRDRRFKTPVGVFTYRYLTKEKYREGIDLVWMDPRHPALMASPEKALCDYVVLNKISQNSSKDTPQFLSDDLRIDPAHWKRLDLIKLHRLNRTYKSSTMDKILAHLEETRS